MEHPTWDNTKSLSLQGLKVGWNIKPHNYKQLFAGSMVILILISSILFVRDVDMVRNWLWSAGLYGLAFSVARSLACFPRFGFLSLCLNIGFSSPTAVNCCSDIAGNPSWPQTLRIVYRKSLVSFAVVGHEEVAILKWDSFITSEKLCVGALKNQFARTTQIEPYLSHCHYSFLYWTSCIKWTGSLLTG